jgi:hypothetical protein
MKGKIFTAQEVKAIMTADKTQFREAIKPQPNSEINPVYLKECNSWQWATKESRRECPYKVGQKIFVKESFFSGWKNKVVMYATEGNPLLYGRKRPAQHMRQEHSRIILQIKEVKVEKENNLWVWVINFEVI